jgi:hypothetical protein
MATAVATVAIGGLAITPAVVAQVDPIHSGQTGHTAARAGHARHGHGLSIANAAGPAEAPALAGAPFAANGPRQSSSSASGVQRRRASSPAALIPSHAAHRVHHGHGNRKSHATTPAPTSPKPGKGAPAGARSTNSSNGNGNGSGDSPTSRGGDKHVQSPNPRRSHPHPTPPVAPLPPATTTPPHAGGQTHRTPTASSSHPGNGHAGSPGF